MGLPGGPVVKNPPWSGRGPETPHATEQLSTQATIPSWRVPSPRATLLRLRAATRRSVRHIQRPCMAQLTQPTTSSTQPNECVNK